MDQSTVVLFVEGGAIQGVEGDAPVRVIRCDFDSTDGPETVAGRPCRIGIWEAPDEPGDEFREVLRLAGADAEGTQEEDTLMESKLFNTCLHSFSR